MPSSDKPQTNGGTNDGDTAVQFQVVSLMASHEVKARHEEVFRALTSSLAPVTENQFPSRSDHTRSYSIKFDAEKENYGRYPNERLSDGISKMPDRANHLGQGTTSVFDKVPGRYYNSDMTEDAVRSIQPLGFDGDLNHHKSSMAEPGSTGCNPSRELDEE
ncbi:hypothetical protein I302_106366 [Kwoniella bestiolae CBS 10118]|uniref:Uncharacterized protein n=1 Tax=Kwoniella bestiolae CBS 10118 TaxID=1296100 RepID=A0A1B9G3R1_9TREE|nr:hypothetical protein I302_05489 [Kwoniella bestiolae CBS 10118]OCF25665.1 hypothetical protein I302_05489 [Kwoniella bestiolae CBS 10118]